jgi:hypothetical protein
MERSVHGKKEIRLDSEDSKLKLGTKLKYAMTLSLTSYLIQILNKKDV